MRYKDIIKRQSVKVNNGSGILVKPLADDFLYVFTASHVLAGLTEKDIKLSLANDIEVQFNYDVVKVYRADDDSDAAIIKIKTNYTVEFLILCEDVDSMQNVIHVGFPISRRTPEAMGDYIEYPIIDIGQTLGQWIEYEYGKVHPKSEMEECSGGAIIDGNFNLLGVHKGTANVEEQEYNGKALMIPISSFKCLISHYEELQTILHYDLSSFAKFTPKAFNIDHDRMRKDLDKLLSVINWLLAEINKLSPEEIFNKLKEEKQSWGNKVISEYQEETWVEVVEYLVGAHLITGIELNNGNVCLMAKKLRFIYAEEDFQIENAPEKIAPSLLGKIDKNTVVVVGGLKSESCVYDVKAPNSQIPDIAIAKVEEEGLDIATGGKQFMAYVTFVNNKLFTDVMKRYPKEISQYKGNVQDFYKQLLMQYIYGR